MNKYFELILNFINSLSLTEIHILIAVVIILVSILIFRWFSIKMAFAFLFFCLIAYTLYINDAFSIYEKQKQIKNAKEAGIQEELNKMK